AQKKFEKVFSEREIPEDIPVVVLKDDSFELVKALADNGVVSSRSEARRLIIQGAVRVDKQKVSDINYRFVKGKEYIVKVGKRRFVKFVT
ncbi:MAG: tyrosine--tRNA ligase, partial [Candidatus Neomarinimicrobiota bacterium]